MLQTLITFWFELFVFSVKWIFSMICRHQEENLRRGGGGWHKAHAPKLLPITVIVLQHFQPFWLRQITVDP